MTLNTQDVKALLEPIESAIALGAEIPAPVGSVLYEVRYFAQDQGEGEAEWVIGRYRNHNDCVLALANWIIAEWDNSGIVPWGRGGEEPRLLKVEESDDPVATYLELFTPSETIDDYFQNTNDRYLIERYEIQGTPDSLFSLKD